MFAKNLTIPRSLLLTTALVIISVALMSCGSDDTSGEVVQVATSPAPTIAPTDQPLATTATVQQQPASASASIATLTPAPTQVPTAKIVPTTMVEPTPEPPYWTRIGVRDAIEKYPPLNERTDYGLRNTQKWLNGGPTTIRDLQEAGKIVLVDFWTYT